MIRSIALLEPKTDINTIYSFSVTPRIGILTIGNILRRHGYEVSVFVDSLRRTPVQQLTRYDLVGISMLTCTAVAGYRYADQLRRGGLRVVLGGPHPTFLPDEGLDHADFVVRREGEYALLELVEALNAGRPLDGICGLSFRHNGEVRHNPDREFGTDYLDTEPALDLVKGIRRFSRGWLSRYRMVPAVSTSRGCPRACHYCSVIQIAGRIPRYRTLDACLRDVREATRYTRKDIAIVDDNFVMNVKRSKEFLRGLIAMKLPRDYTFMTQINVGALADDELLALMKEANFELLHVAYESINQAMLQEWGKSHSFEGTEHSVRQARKHGLRINAMFIVGGDADNEQTIRDTTNFAIQSDVAAMQMWILTPLPGSALFHQVLAEGRIFNTCWQHYDCQHSVFFPKRIPPSRLQIAVRDANRRFYTVKRMFGRSPGNRITYGANAWMMDRWMKRYAEKLRRVEQGLYDDSGHLIADRLLRRFSETLTDLS